MWKVLIAKKVGITLLLLGSGFADSRTTAIGVSRGRREVNPIIRPLEHSSLSYPAIMAPSFAATYMLWRHPKSKITNPLVIGSLATYTGDVTYNLITMPAPQKIELTWALKR